MSAAPIAAWQSWSDGAHPRVERALAEAIERVAPPAEASALLAEAMRYALFGPGKRLRPLLVLVLGEHLGADARACEPALAAVEMAHSYSLVHDDLPCMDDDRLRRGRPTCHVVYGEAIAVLVGDALLTGAFEELARAPCAAESVGVLARAIGARGMVGGQGLDLSLPLAASAADVERMHAQKTGALIAAAAELGALAAQAPDRELAARFGRALGACFQAVDDVLDVTGDSAALGKTPGKDQKLERATLVAALGLEGARERALRHADAARVAARELGFGPATPGYQLVDYLLQRRK